MRKTPVTRDEVRLNQSEITTLPADAVCEGENGFGLRPIAKLWAPLLRSLNRAQKRRWDANAAIREAAGRFGIRHKPPEPITAPWPRPLSWPRACWQCDKEFYLTRRGSRWCSDRCAAEARRLKKAASNAVRVKEQSAARATARPEPSAGPVARRSRRSGRPCGSVRCAAAWPITVGGVC